MLLNKKNHIKAVPRYAPICNSLNHPIIFIGKAKRLLRWEVLLQHKNYSYNKRGVSLPKITDDELKKFKGKYEKRIVEDMKAFDRKVFSGDGETYRSREYIDFKESYMPRHMTWYEKACNWAENIMKTSPDPKKIPDLQEAITTCHLNITPEGVASFAFIGPLLFMLIGAIVGYTFTFVLVGKGSLFYVIFAFICGLILIPVLNNYPKMLASIWRMRASNQMVLCVFYIVTYMRHTSNLELAIDFAAEHLGPPLSLDLKKVMWNLETGESASIKESLDTYLMSWRKYNMEFIEAMHLIESSLYESSDARRIDALEKSLKVILEETYEKMLHYAQNLKSPLTMLNMLGIVLPVLGLVILPLVVSFAEGVEWYHLFAIYNIAIPVGVYALGRKILATRPSGYGDTDIAEDNPELKKFRNVIWKFGNQEMEISPINFALFVGVILLFIGFLPLLIHGAAPNFDIEFGIFKLIDFKENKYGEMVGPYGLGAALLSVFVPLAFAFGIGLYAKLRSKNVLKIRNEAKKLEEEFASALFQLGNRLGDGLPVEIAFGKVADVMEGTVSGDFFTTVDNNIRMKGMSVEQAIFDRERGALLSFPSSLIEGSMKVLIESAKKGPYIASLALINISEYIKEMHRVDERLKDLLADTISSMKTQIKFLSPAISGIVIGITSMITTILGHLSDLMTRLTTENTIGSQVTIAQMFGLGIPTYHFQIIVGLYVVQLIYILSVIVNGIENGEDKLSERYTIGTNLMKSPVIYCVIAIAVMLIFNVLAGTILKGLA